MKTQNRLFKCFLLTGLLTAAVFEGKAQVGALTKTGDMTVCLNSTQPYGVTPTAGSTYDWIIIAGTGGAGTIIAGEAPNNLISVLWTNAGTCTLQVIETAGTCPGEPVMITVTVLPGLDAGTTSADQSICYGAIPDPVSATGPAGGNGTTTYQWESSTDEGITWDIIAGATSLEYSPGALIRTTWYHLIQSEGTGCGAATTADIIISVQPQVITSPIFHD